MRKSKYKIQIGDVLYEPSNTYHRVIEWEIKDIFVEHYLCGDKTIFVVESSAYGRCEKFLGTVAYWPDTYEDAEKELLKN